MRNVTFRVWFHRVSAFAWIAMLYPAVRYWPESVLFVILASLYANIMTAWSASEAADDRQILEKLDRLEKLIKEGRK